MKTKMNAVYLYISKPNQPELKVEYNGNNKPTTISNKGLVLMGILKKRSNHIWLVRPTRCWYVERAQLNDPLMWVSITVPEDEYINRAYDVKVEGIKVTIFPTYKVGMELSIMSPVFKVEGLVIKVVKTKNPHIKRLWIKPTLMSYIKL